MLWQVFLGKKTVGELTDWLNRARGGDADAAERAFAAVYGELKRIASRSLGPQAQATLSPTALVHEAFLKLLPDQSRPLNDRQHFFRLAARAMRQIIVDEARRRAAEKRGGDVIRTDLSGAIGVAGENRVSDLLAIDQALTRLEARDGQLAHIVEAHFFAGLTFEEIAADLGTSDRSVRRDWDTARAFLLRDLQGAAAR
jgi:RNA polymerase sigma factor (TIGR02999 family)